MKKTLAILFFVLLLISCKSAKDRFRFEKIMYHSGPCFGSCPSYHMQIGSDRTVLLKGDSLYNKRMGNANYSRIGYFTGKVSDSSYNKLLNELRTVGLDTLQFGSQNCCDAPMKTLIVYYNGKRKYFRSMFPPSHTQRLITILNDIHSKTHFEPTEQRFEIEYDSVPKNKRQ